MADLPEELSTGMVHGRFIVALIDGDDAGQEPDVIPAKGTIRFKSSVPYVPVPITSAGPVTVMKGPVIGVLDSEGYLSTPHPVTGEIMYRGVKLIATNDPDMAVTDWTWTAEYVFESVASSTMQIPAHAFALETGSSVDLTTVLKVPATTGYGLPQAEAAALRAEQAAQVALDVKAMADAGEFDGDQGAPGNATMRIDTTVGTRIFITDGVTERMVSGDTGVRNIASLVPAGWTIPNSNAFATIRRTGPTVFLEARLQAQGNIVAKKGLSMVLGVLPVGYRWNGNFSVGGGAKLLPSVAAATPTSVGVVHSSGNLYVTFPTDTGTWVDGECVNFQLSWQTLDAWPSSQIGVSV